LETGTIDGQDNPLSTTYRAKFYEVTKQVVLTDHIIPANMLAISKPVWDALTPKQQAILEDAAKAAMMFNDTNKFRDDESLAATFRDAGLDVTIPDKQAFRDHVLKVFRDEGYLKNAPAGWVEAIEAAAK
jgi:TRAP-type C4-dicarboxylate transport system substrate-binding protein